MHTMRRPFAVTSAAAVALATGVVYSGLMTESASADPGWYSHCKSGLRWENPRIDSTPTVYTVKATVTKNAANCKLRLVYSWSTGGTYGTMNGATKRGTGLFSAPGKRPRPSSIYNIHVEPVAR